MLMREILSFSLFFVCSFLNGCDSSIEDCSVLDCLISKTMHIETVELPHGYMGQEYYAEIKASIENEPHDNHYSYVFTSNSSLPFGLNLLSDDLRTGVGVLYGTPMESGSFKIKIRVFSGELINERVDYGVHHNGMSCCIEEEDTAEFDLIIH